MQNPQEDTVRIYKSLRVVAETVALSKAYVPFEDGKGRWQRKKAQEALDDLGLILNGNMPIPRHSNNLPERRLCEQGLIGIKNDWCLEVTENTEAAFLFARLVAGLPRTERNHLVRNLMSLSNPAPFTPRQAASGVVRDGAVYAVVQVPLARQDKYPATIEAAFTPAQ